MHQMAGKVHLLPTIPSLTTETELYTQRRSSADTPEPFKFTIGQLFAFLQANNADAVRINPTPLTYIPSNAGNPTVNYNQFVIASNGTAWYIDGQGRGKNFNETSADIVITDPTKGIVMNGQRGRFTNDGILTTENQ